MDFLRNLAKGAQDLFGNLFGKKQDVISPLQNNADRSTMPQGFIGPVVPPVTSTPNPAPRQPSGGSGGGGGGGGAQPQSSTGLVPGVAEDVDRFLQAMVNPLQAEIESWCKRLDQYDKNNPFAFDEALARASSEERLNPYFDATMNEFMTGVRRSSSRSVEDMTRTIGELNVDASKLSDKERLNTQEAIRSSEEGFAGAGLFFSGRRARATGMEDVQGGQVQEDIQTNLDRGVSGVTRGNTRVQEDLALQEARTKRLTEAERTTALETEISKQKRESALQRGLERLQFAGKIPGAGPAQQLQLENEFMSGLV